jgi:S-adenosylmethionine:tRNA ribosyltransferase-isomerase
VVDRAAGAISHRAFRDLGDYLRPGDRLCLNNTRVVKARFFSDDGKIELLRLDILGERSWRCLVKPGKKMRPGAHVMVGGCQGRVLQTFDQDGSRLIQWETSAPDEERHGQLALPHYMARSPEAADEGRYQTVYADPAQAGAIAAPTAGLHFTPEMLAGLPHSFVTLHVGVGTFRPVQADLIKDHVMHSERYHLEPQVCAELTAAHRIIAVGTTVTRVLEHIAGRHGRLIPESGSTAIFITPGYQFKAIGALLTNFHLPKSTLLMLVSALAGRGLIMEAYAQAVRERYRFYSYGDCMLIL